MKIFFSILACVYTLTATVANCQKEKCYTVEKGSHYSQLIPFNGFTSSEKQYSQIKFSANSASYLFDSTDPKGHLCTTSWNKLFGVSRCGYFNHQHSDSDRFVWRRAQSCLNMSNGHVNSEDPNCSERGLIEIGKQEKLFFCLQNTDFSFNKSCICV